MIEPVFAVRTASAPDAKPGFRRLPYLDGLRALAALFVVVHHAWAQVWPVFEAPHAASWPQGALLYATGFLYYGHFAVGVFIVLSGFCLMLPSVGTGALAGGAVSFFCKRARRILPPYFASLALSLVLIASCLGHKSGTHWDNSLPVTWDGLLAHLFLLHDLWQPHQINYPLWSIAVEWHIYFLFPLLLVSWRRLGPLLTTLLAVVLSYNAQFLLAGTLFASITPQYFALFVLGMLAATVSFSPDPFWLARRQRPFWAALAGGLAVLLIGLCWRLGFVRAGAYQADLDYRAGIAAAALLVSVSSAPNGRLHAFLAWKPLVWLGSFSYSLYLVHAPLLQLVSQYVLVPYGAGWSRGEMFAVMVCGGLPVVVACAYLFFRLAEKPFLPGRSLLSYGARYADTLKT